MLRKKSFSRTSETMKLLTTPQSSVKSSSGSTSGLGSDNKDSCYFPGCRKDANCKCEICIASMNATLDLMPPSIQRSSLTRLPATADSRNPIPFNQLSPSTPKLVADLKSFDISPPMNSGARINFQEKLNKDKKRQFFSGFMSRRFFLGLGIILLLEFGVSWMVSGVFQPKLSANVVRQSGQKSRVLKDLNQRLGFLKNELQGLVNTNITDCTSLGSNWKLNQDGLLLHSKCMLYKSMSEEISIWGWPLQTAGLLTADFSSRSFTILSGRVTEWTNGRINYIIRKSSWRQQKWESSAVQLDTKTWILEYKQSYIIENARLVSATLNFIKFRMTREMEKMKQDFWQAFAWSHPTDLRLSSRTPT